MMSLGMILLKWEAEIRKNTATVKRKPQESAIIFFRLPVVRLPPETMRLGKTPAKH